MMMTSMRLLHASRVPAASASALSAAGVGARRCISKKKVRLTNVPVLWPIEGVDEPPSLLPHEIDVATRLFKNESKLITSTGDLEDLPEWSIPEIAFAGRSNVGKSSIINALVGQPGLVRTSKTPGRTQKLHFFSVGGKVGSLPDLALVDMPGYGFATAPKAVVDEWHDLVGGFIRHRRGSNLKTIYLLVDSRRGIAKVDEDFMDYLHDLGMIYQVVFTKADTVTVPELTKQIQKAQQIAMRIDRISMNPIIHVSSTKENFGIRELQRQMISMTGLLMNR